MFEPKVTCDHSSRFKGLLSARDKALSVFRKAHNELQSSVARLEVEIGACVNREQEHNANAEREVSARLFLQAEAEKASKTAAKLKEILS